MQDFRRLRVWHAAHELSVNITNAFSPRYDTKTSVLRKRIIGCAQAIPSNVAKGCGQPTSGEFLECVEASVALADELLGHLKYARETHQLSATNYDWMTERTSAIRTMLLALQRNLQQAHALELEAHALVASG